MKKLAALLFALLLGAPVYGQVRQSGNVTPGHAAVWTANGVVQDAGSAANPYITSFGVMGPNCVISGPITGQYQSFCMSTSLAGGAVLSTQNFGGATAKGISFNINGTLAGLATVALPTTSSDGACFSNTTGLIGDCGFAPIGNSLASGNIFVGNASNLAVGVTPSGDVSTTNAGVFSVGNLSHVSNGSLGNAGLANTGVTVNGQICTLGASCSIASLPAGAGGVSGQMQWNSSGALAGTAQWTTNGTTLTEGSPGILQLNGTLNISGPTLVSAANPINFTVNNNGANAFYQNNCMLTMSTLCAFAVGGQHGGVGIGTIIIGASSGPNVVSTYTANDNFFAGVNIGNEVTTADRNVIIGNGSIPNLTTGVSNTCLGTVCGNNMTTASYITAIGDEACAGVITVDNVICIGVNVGGTSSLYGYGPYDIMIGGNGTSLMNEGNGVTPAGLNIAIALGATGALNSLTSGTKNFACCWGVNGFYLTTGSYNVIFGSFSDNANPSNSYIFTDPLSGALRFDYNYTAATTFTVTGKLVTTDTISGVLANTATTSAICYNTSTHLFTYDGTIGTCNTSDERLKVFDGPLVNPLGKLIALSNSDHFGYFHWIDTKRYGEGEKIGLGAQTLERYFPGLTATGSDGLMSAAYDKLTVPIIAAIAELKADNDNLRQEVNILKRKVTR